MIYKERYGEYKDKYSTPKIINFVLDMKELKQGKIKLSHKGVIFASLNKEEYMTFDSWNKQEQLNFLNGYWNFYISLQD